MKGIYLDRLWNKYPTPRPYKRQNQRDKHDFNDRCIAVATKRIKADRKSTRLNSSHIPLSRMPSSA